MLKKRKKLKVHFRRAGGGCKASSTSQTMLADDILEELKSLNEKYGTLVIDYIDEDVISVTTPKSIENYSIESKLEEIKDMIRDKVFDK